MGNMRKTTLELPASLMREIKVRAAAEDRRIKDIVAEALERGLHDSTASRHSAVQHRIELPLVDSHPADPGAEMTPDRLAQALLAQEAQWGM